MDQNSSRMMWDTDKVLPHSLLSSFYHLHWIFCTLFIFLLLKVLSLCNMEAWCNGPPHELKQWYLHQCVWEREGSVWLAGRLVCVCMCVTLHLISFLLSFLLLVWLPGVFVCAQVSMCIQHIHLPWYHPSLTCVLSVTNILEAAVHLAWSCTGPLLLIRYVETLTTWQPPRVPIRPVSSFYRILGNLLPSTQAVYHKNNAVEETASVRWRHWCEKQTKETMSN